MFTGITRAIWWKMAKPFESSIAYKPIMSIKLTDDKYICIAKNFNRYKIFTYHKGIDGNWYYSSLLFYWYLDENKKSITLYLNDNNKKCSRNF